MPPNRRGRRRRGRGGQASSQHERATPYERPEDEEAPSATVASQTTSRQTNSRRTHSEPDVSAPDAARPVTSNPTVVRSGIVRVVSPAPMPIATSRSAHPTTQPNVATAPVPNRGPDSSERSMEEEDEDMLVRLALTWKESRKLSLSLFHADLAASFERNQIQIGKDRKMQPTEAEHKLQVIEMKWRCSPGFRGSGSGLARRVGRWMTQVREVEEQERTRLEVYRKQLLEDDMVGAEAPNIVSHEMERYEARRLPIAPWDNSDDDAAFFARDEEPEDLEEDSEDSDEVPVLLDGEHYDFEEERNVRFNIRAAREMNQWRMIESLTPAAR
jgi:hypothetical protein